MKNNWKQPDYLPTPKEIEQKCEEIQRRWSERERRRRMRCVVSDSEYAGPGERELVKTDHHERVPYHPDALTTGRKQTCEPLSTLGA